jgi:hypothetical protein
MAAKLPPPATALLSASQPHLKKVQLVGHLAGRRGEQRKVYQHVTGVVHFLLDLDLVTGYVHQYTKTMHQRLRPNDFVLR